MIPAGSKPSVRLLRPQIQTAAMPLHQTSSRDAHVARHASRSAASRHAARAGRRPRSANRVHRGEVVVGPAIAPMVAGRAGDGGRTTRRPAEGNRRLPRMRRRTRRASGAHTVCAMSRRDRQRRRNRNRQGHGAGRIVFLGFGVVLATLAIGVLGVVGWVASVANSAPSIDELKPVNPGSSSVVYAADGTRLGFIQSDILRTQVRYADIPQTMKDATIAIEDKRFYEHKGVDFEGILRAGVKNVTTGKTVQGGSTLTMQLVRNLYTDDARATASRATSARSARPSSPRSSRTSTRRTGSSASTSTTSPTGPSAARTALGVQAAARDVLQQAGQRS